MSAEAGSPQSVLADAALREKQSKQPDESMTAFALRQVGAAHLDAACDMLDNYEVEQGVRFIALPVRALRDLREAWETQDDDVLREASLAHFRDLFGGIDGHLTAIDKALPRTGA